jgi:hypothetical protein
LQFRFQGYSLEQYLQERLKFTGMQKVNLNDLAGIVVGAKFKHSITANAVNVQASRRRNALTARYPMDPLLLNKMLSLFLDTPRLASASSFHVAFPKATQIELNIAIGEWRYFSKYSFRNSTVA